MQEYHNPNAPVEALPPGLYIVATPIGCLEDITLRALRLLRACDRIACEDTRVSGKLLRAFAIEKPMMLYHDHNAQQAREKVVAHIEAGEAVALISDAGTPLMADPGFKLVQACYERGLRVTFAPGPTAFVGAVVLSGLPPYPLSFLGFASNASASVCAAWRDVQSTLVFFEAPHKLRATLAAFATRFPNRDVAVVREMTKIFEEVVRGTWVEVTAHFAEHEPRGEIAFVLSPPTERFVDEAWQTELETALKTQSLRDAVDGVTARHNLSRKLVYARALLINTKKV